VNKLSVLIPVYNESRTLRTIVAKVLASPVGLELELVCVDDRSEDDSLEILRELAASDDRIKVVAQPVNMGKGKAIRTAIEHMTGDVAVIQDADLEYDPAQYPQVIKPILDGRADAVYGSRFAAGAERRVLFFWHALGNRLLTLLSNMANNLNLTDMETCYKAVRCDVLKRLRLTSDGFGLEPEITARLARWGARIYETPISYHGRTYAEGKKIGWRDGFEAFWLVLKFRFLDSTATEEGWAATRQSLGPAPRFRRWLLDQFTPHLGAALLEVGAGTGHTTALLLGSRRLVAIDSDPVHAETLRRRYGHLENVRVEAADLESDPLDERGLDTAVIFDGLQRSDDPEALLRGVAEHLEPGGHVLIQVPAGKDLLGEVEEAPGGMRRFERGEVEELIGAAGLELTALSSFNRVGRVAWKVLSVVGRPGISRGQARLLDLLVPLARRLDRVLLGRGLSYVAVARVP